jgi:hypothetical protein
MKIFHAGTPTDDLLHLEQLAECFGIRAELIDVQASQSLPGALAREGRGTGAGWVLDLSSLKSYLEPIAQLRETAEILAGCGAAVLLLVMDGSEVTSQALEVLTGSGVAGLRNLTSAESVTFPESGSLFSRELSSQTFGRGAKKAVTLTLAELAKMTPVMDLDGSTSFAHRQVRLAEIFVWSTTGIFDVRRPLKAETEFELACDEYIPAIIFFRAAFGDRCWHNPTAGAGIVIDDPLLKKKYGFIDFEKLLESARTHAYHVTLAFIPWNQWRSRVRDVKLFLDYSDCFSICVHGCDHTRNEYGFADYDGLLRKNFVAQKRMDRHGRRTGLESEPLMVCPQEKYSLEAMEAFSDSRQFLGLACTACMPRNQASAEVCGADLLLPAQDCLFGFPIFKRHYWGDMSVFAMALFLGKPAILVEHHEFFRHGPGGAEEFVQRLAELRPDLEWRSLGETMARTHARRLVSEGNHAIRFFTDRFTLEHQIEGPAEYSLVRRVPEASVVERVLVRNETTPFTRDRDFVRFETHAHKRETMPVQVDVAPVRPSGTYPNGIKYQTSVALRRGLSELRDNFLAKNHLALRTGRFLVRSLQRTGRKNPVGAEVRADEEESQH